MTHSVQGSQSGNQWGQVKGNQPETLVGQGLNRKVELHPGQAVLGTKKQIVEQTGASLAQRTAQVLTEFDTYLLNQGAGGVKSNKKQYAALQKSVKDLNKQVEKFEKASQQFTKAANELMQAREKAGWDALPKKGSDLYKAEMQLVKAQNSVRQAGDKLVEAQDKLDLSVGMREGNKSVLDGFYSPESAGLFGKQNKEVFEVRLQAVDELQKELRSTLVNLGSDSQQGKMEAARLNQQLQEIGQSKLDLQTRLGSDKKFHKNDMPVSSGHQRVKGKLEEKHRKFRVALASLREARSEFDRAILTTPEGSKLRGKTQKKYVEAEKTVSQKATALKNAEKKYSVVLTSDRKAASSTKKEKSSQRPSVTPETRSTKKTSSGNQKTASG